MKKITLIFIILISACINQENEQKKIQEIETKKINEPPKTIQNTVEKIKTENTLPKELQEITFKTATTTTIYGTTTTSESTTSNTTTSESTTSNTTLSESTTLDTTVTTIEDITKSTVSSTTTSTLACFNLCTEVKMPNVANCKMGCCLTEGLSCQYIPGGYSAGGRCTCK